MTLQDMVRKEYNDFAGDQRFVEHWMLTADPSVAPGWTAPPGSIGQYTDAAPQSDGKLYLKTGPADTDWVELSPGAKTPTFVVGNQADGDTTAMVDYLEDGTGTAIQDAINALAGGGGWIHIRRGTYVNAATVTVPENVKLTGVGPGTVIQEAANGTVFQMMPAGDHVVGNVFEDMQLVAAAAAYGIFCAYDGDLTLNRVHMNGGESALGLFGAAPPAPENKALIFVNDCRFTQVVNAVEVNGSQIKTLVITNTSAWDSWTMLRVVGQTPATCTLAGNHFYGTMGTSFWLAGDFQDEDSQVNCHSNHIESEACFGFTAVGSMARFSFKDNHWVLLTAPWQWIAPARGLVVDGDVLEDPNAVGNRSFNVQADYPALPNNNDIVFRNVKALNITLQSVVGAVVESSEIGTVYVDSSDFVNISDCEFVTPAGNGNVEFQGTFRPSEAVHITNNKFRVGNGVYYSAQAVNVIIEGNEFGVPLTGPGGNAVAISQPNAGGEGGFTAIRNNIFNNIPHPVYWAGTLNNGAGKLEFTGNQVHRSSPSTYPGGLTFANGFSGLSIDNNVFVYPGGAVLVSLPAVMSEFSFSNNTIEISSGPFVIIDAPAAGAYENWTVDSNIVHGQIQDAMFIRAVNGKIKNGSISHNMLKQMRPARVLDLEPEETVIMGNMVHGTVSDTPFYFHSSYHGGADSLISHNVLPVGGTQVQSVFIDAGAVNMRVIYNRLPMGLTDTSGGPTATNGNW